MSRITQPDPIDALYDRMVGPETPAGGGDVIDTLYDKMVVGKPHTPETMLAGMQAPPFASDIAPQRAAGAHTQGRAMFEAQYGRPPTFSEDQQIAGAAGVPSVFGVAGAELALPGRSPVGATIGGEDGPKWVDSRGPVGFGEAIGKTGEKQIPFVGQALGAVDSLLVLNSARRMAAGEYDAEDVGRVAAEMQKAYDAEARGQTVGGIAGDILREAPAFMVEFASGGWATKGIKVGARKAAKEAIETMIRKRAIGQTAGLAEKAAGGVASAAARIPIVAPGRVVSGTAERMTPTISGHSAERGMAVTDPGDPFPEALYKATGDQFVEILSEMSGGAIMKGLGKAGGAAAKVLPKETAEGLKKSVARWWFLKNPAASQADFAAKLAKGAGWHGIIGEVMEERTAEVGRAALGVDDQYRPPTLKQLAAEGIAFTAIGGGMAATGAAGNAWNRSREARQDKKDSNERRNLEALEEFDLPGGRLNPDVQVLRDRILGGERVRPGTVGRGGAGPSTQPTGSPPQPTAQTAQPPAQQAPPANPIDILRDIEHEAMAELKVRHGSTADTSQTAAPGSTEQQAGTSALDDLLGVKPEAAKAPSAPAATTPKRGGSTLAELLRDDTVPAPVRKGLAEKYAAGEIDRDEFVAGLEASIAASPEEKLRREFEAAASTQKGGEDGVLDQSDTPGGVPQEAQEGGEVAGEDNWRGKSFAAFSREYGREVMVTPSVNQPGKWQVTRFDKDGRPSGDTVYPSWDEMHRTETRYGLNMSTARDPRTTKPQQPGPVSAAPQPGATHEQEEGQEEGLLTESAARGVTSAPERVVPAGSQGVEGGPVSTTGAPPAESLSPPAVKGAQAPLTASVPFGEPHPTTGRKFSSTQFDMPDEIARAVKAEAAKIPDADLAEDGREDRQHVTIKYGLHADDAARVREAVRDIGPVTVTLGETSLFQNDDADVVKIDVDSPALHALNKAIAGAVETTDTHKDYKPHVTLAYVKPGRGKKYAGNKTLAGRTVTLDRVVFSGRDGTETEIRLTGKPDAPPNYASTPPAEVFALAKQRGIDAKGGKTKVVERLRQDDAAQNKAEPEEDLRQEADKPATPKVADATPDVAPDTAKSAAPHFIDLKNILTPAGSIKAGALGRTRTPSSLWYHQGDPQNLAFAARMTVAGQAPSAEAKQRLARVLAAEKQGWKFRNYRAGKYGTLYVLQRDDSVLTEAGLAAMDSAASARPTLPDIKPGEYFGPRMEAYIKALMQWMGTLPSGEASDPATISRAMASGAVASWARTRTTSTGKYTIEFLNEDGSVDLLVDGDTAAEAFDTVRRIAKDGYSTGSLKPRQTKEDPTGVHRDEGDPTKMGLKDAAGLRIIFKEKRDGWHYADPPGGSAVVLVHPTENLAVRFRWDNEKSGSQHMRARAEAQAFAQDHPVQRLPDVVPAEPSEIVENADLYLKIDTGSVYNPTDYQAVRVDGVKTMFGEPHFKLANGAKWVKVSDGRLYKRRPAGEIVVKPLAAAQEARREAALSQDVRTHAGEVMGRRELVDKELAEGGIPSIVEVADTAAVSKAKELIDRMNRGDGPPFNDAHPDRIAYDAAKKTVANPPGRDEYRMKKADGVWRVLTKTEYDYAVGRAGRETKPPEPETKAPDRETPPGVGETKPASGETGRVVTVGDPERIEFDDGTSLLRWSLSDGTFIDEFKGGAERWRPAGPGRQSLGQYLTRDEALVAADTRQVSPTAGSVEATGPAPAGLSLPLSDIEAFARSLRVLARESNVPGQNMAMVQYAAELDRFSQNHPPPQSFLERVGRDIAKLAKSVRDKDIRASLEILAGKIVGQPAAEPTAPDPTGGNVEIGKYRVFEKDGGWNVHWTDSSGAGQGRSGLKTRKEAVALAEQWNAKDQENAADRRARYPMTAAEWPGVKRKVLSGDITAAELKDLFRWFARSESQIKTELGQRKLKDLAPRGTGGRTKGELIDAIYGQMFNVFNLGRSYEWQPFGGETAQSALTKAIESITDDDIAKFKAERQAAVDEHKKALENPESIEDFRTFVRIKGEEALSLDQRKRYDALQAEHAKTLRGDDRPDHIAKIDTGAIEFSYKEGFHEKQGIPLHIVQMTGRVPDETYRALVAAAKKLGGWWSSFKKDSTGFQFKTKEAADEFIKVNQQSITTEATDKLRDEGSVQRSAERLADLAAGKAEAAQAELDKDRNTNTVRRASMAEGAEKAARKAKQLADTLANIAEGISKGSAKALRYVKNMAQVEELERMLMLAQREYYYSLPEESRRAVQRSGDWWNIPLDENVIGKVVMPVPEPHISHMRSIAEVGLKTSGIKREATKLDRLWREAQRKNPDSPVIKIDNPYDFTAAKTVASRLKSFGEAKYSAEMVYDALMHHQRLADLNIRSSPEARVAIREYMTFRAGQAQPDAVREMERSLIGQKVGIDFFPTPPDVAADLVQRADIKPGMKVLEPSAGNGRIADAIKNAGVVPDTVELSSQLRGVLEAKGHTLVAQDFMAFDPGPVYDRIVMNPPFGNRADIDHVRHAYEMLAPGGRIVAVMSEGPFFAQEKKAAEFREWLDDVGSSEKLPEGTFEQDKSGLPTTGVNTRIVVIDKPGEAPGSKLTISYGSTPVGTVAGPAGVTPDALAEKVSAFRKRLDAATKWAELQGMEDEAIMLASAVDTAKRADLLHARGFRAAVQEKSARLFAAKSRDEKDADVRRAGGIVVGDLVTWKTDGENRFGYVEEAKPDKFWIKIWKPIPHIDNGLYVAKSIYDVRKPGREETPMAILEGETQPERDANTPNPLLGTDAGGNPIAASQLRVVGRPGMDAPTPRERLKELLAEKMRLEKEAKSAFYRIGGESTDAAKEARRTEERKILDEADELAGKVADYVEMQVGQYPGEIPKVERTTPKAGTAEARKIESDFKQADKAMEEMWAAEREIDREVASKSPGTKVRASLEAKRERVREQVASAKAVWVKTRDRWYRYGQEEAIDGSDPWRRLGVISQLYKGQWTEISQYLTRVAEYIVEVAAPELDAVARNKVARDSVFQFLESPRSGSLTSRLDTDLYVHVKRANQERAFAEIEAAAPLQSNERAKARNAIELTDDPAKMQAVVDEYKAIAAKRDAEESAARKAQEEAAAMEREANTDSLVDPARMKTPTAKQAMGSLGVPVTSPVVANSRTAIVMAQVPPKAREQLAKLPIEEVTASRGGPALSAEKMERYVNDMAAKATRPVVVLGAMSKDGEPVVLVTHSKGEVEGFNGKFFGFIASLAPGGVWRTAGVGSAMVLFNNENPVGVVMPLSQTHTPSIDRFRAQERAEKGWAEVKAAVPVTHRPGTPEKTATLDTAAFPALESLGISTEHAKDVAEIEAATAEWGRAIDMQAKVEAMVQETQAFRDRVHEIAKQQSGREDPPSHYYFVAGKKALGENPQYQSAVEAVEKSKERKKKAETKYEVTLQKVQKAWTPEIDRAYIAAVESKRWWQLEDEAKRIERSWASDPRIKVLRNLAETRGKDEIDTRGEVLPPDFKPGVGLGSTDKTLPRDNFAKPVGGVAFDADRVMLETRNRERGPATWVMRVSTEVPNATDNVTLRATSDGQRKPMEAIKKIADDVPEFRVDPVLTVSADGKTLDWSAGGLSYKIVNPWYTVNAVERVDAKGKKTTEHGVPTFEPFKPGDTIRVDLDEIKNAKGRWFFVHPEADTKIAADTPAGQKAMSVLDRLSKVALDAMKRMESRAAKRGARLYSNPIPDPRDMLDAAVFVGAHALRGGIKGGRALTKIVADQTAALHAALPQTANITPDRIRRAVLALLKQSGGTPEGLRKAWAEARTALDRRKVREVGGAVGDKPGVKKAAVEAQAAQPEIVKAIAKARKQARHEAMIDAVDEADRMVRQAIRDERAKGRRDKQTGAIEARAEREGIVRDFRDRARAVETIKKKLVSDITLYVKNKASQARFLKAVATVKTLGQLRTQTERIKRVYAHDAARVAWADIRKNTRWTRGAKIPGKRERPGPMKLLFQEERANVNALKDEANALREKFKTAGRDTLPMLADARRMVEIAKEIGEIVESARQRTIEIGAALRAKRDSLAAKTIEGIERAVRLSNDISETKDPKENLASRLARGWGDVATNLEIVDASNVLREIGYDEIVQAENAQYAQLHEDQVELDKAAKEAGFKGANDLMVQGTEIAGEALARTESVTLGGKPVTLNLGQMIDIAGHAKDTMTRDLIESGATWKFDTKRGGEAFVIFGGEVDAIAARVEQIAPGLMAAMQKIKQPRFMQAAMAKYQLTGVYPKITGEHHWPRGRDLGEAPQAGLPEIARGGIVRRFMENAGLYESRTQDSKTPLLIRNGLEVFNEHLNALAAATHMAKPARMAYGLTKHPGVRAAMLKAHGPRVYQVVEEQIAGATGLSDVTQDQDHLARIVRSLNRNLAVANLSLNPRSMAINAQGGLARAAGIVGADVVASGTANVAKVPADLLESRSAFFWRRWNHGGFGRFSPVQEGVPRAESGASWGDIWRVIEKNAKAMDPRGVMTGWRMVQEKAMAVYNLTDRFVANVLYAGLLAESRADNPHWSEARHEAFAVGETERVFRESQNPSSTADMSYNYMKSRGRASSALYLFAGDRFKAWTRLRRAARNDQFARAAAAEMVNLIVARAIRYGVPSLMGLAGAAIFGGGDDNEERKKRMQQARQRGDWAATVRDVVIDVLGTAAPSPVVSNLVAILMGGFNDTEVASTPATEAVSKMAINLRRLVESLDREGPAGDAARTKLWWRIFESAREIGGDPTVGLWRTAKPALP